MTTPGPRINYGAGSAQRVDTVYPAAPFITEDMLLATVTGIAKALGYRTYHTFNSRRSAAGYPDLTLIRQAPEPEGTRLIYVELKSARGRLTSDQRDWLSALATVPGVEVYIWFPADLSDIEDILR